MKKIIGWLLILAVVFVFACFLLFVGIPVPMWDSSPEALIITTEPGDTYIDYGYIPDLQVWGNGDVVWVEYSESGQRSVFSGSLSGDQLRAVLVELIDSGILGVSYTSEDYCQYPGIDNVLHIELILDRTRQILRRADSKVCELSLFLSHGAGAEGTLYRPESGILYAFPLGETSIPMDTAADSKWPEEFAFDLQEVAAKGSIEVNGEALAYAWNIMNSSWNPVIISRGEKFLIAVEIPDISP
jgi:hypothetical protein